MGFRKKGKVLKRKKSLYGLLQSPRVFWNFLTNKMKECATNQTQIDPCLFDGGKVICICYVDDLILCLHNDSDIYGIENLMIGAGVYS